jgi:hypothetical protein
VHLKVTKESGMKRICIIVVLSIGIIGCGGKEWHVAAVVATGVTLKLIQASRAKSFANQPHSKACEIFCDPCTFPCGDNCVMYGTLCAEPPGRACWQGGGRIVGTPPQPAHYHCPSNYEFESHTF